MRDGTVAGRTRVVGELDGDRLTGAAVRGHRPVQHLDRSFRLGTQVEADESDTLRQAYATDACNLLVDIFLVHLH